MGKLLFIDSDDIESLSAALQNALENRGVRFTRNGVDFTNDARFDEEPDIDPYLGVMPQRNIVYGSCSGGHCGGTYTRFGSCGGRCG